MTITSHAQITFISPNKSVTDYIKCPSSLYIKESYHLIGSSSVSKPTPMMGTPSPPHILRTKVLLFTLQCTNWYNFLQSISAMHR